VAVGSDKKSCFVIMPFSSEEGSAYGSDHFQEVYEGLIVPAVEEAGLEPIRADTQVLSRHIVSELLSAIEDADLVLCDLSAANPNVLFELGWAYRADRPCVLIKDDVTDYPFDLQHSHVGGYRSALRPKTVREDIGNLAELITNTVTDTSRRWSLLRSLGLEARLQRASTNESNPVAAALLDLREEVRLLRAGLDRSADSTSERGDGNSSPTPRTALATERTLLEALERNSWNIVRTATELHISRSTLWSLMRRYGIEKPGAD
jgi:hypothetical protein